MMEKLIECILCNYTFSYDDKLQCDSSFEKLFSFSFYFVFIKTFKF